MPKRNSGASLEWRADRGVWEIIEYQRGKRRRRSTSTADRLEASEILARYLLDTKHVGCIAPSERRIDDSLNDYLLSFEQKSSSAETAAYNARVLLRFWSGKTVEDITKKSCADYERFVHGKSPSTIRRELTTLTAALNLDKREKRLTDVPFVWKPAEGPPKDTWLTRREAALLLWFARKGTGRDYLPFAILLLLYASPRKATALGLRWPQVDLERRRIDFNMPGAERTRKRRAVIAIPGRLHGFLARRRLRGMADGYVIHRKGKALGDIKKGVAGAAERAARYCDSRAMKSTGAEAHNWKESATTLRKVTPHVLRHTCITWLAQARVPIEVTAAYAGHASSRTTQRVYIHHSPDYMAEVTKALDRR